MQNEKKLKKCELFSKRVFTKANLCGKLWENQNRGVGVQGKTAAFLPLALTIYPYKG